MKKLFLLLFVVLPILLVAAVVAFAVTSIEKSPIVARTAAPDAQSIARGKVLVRDYQQSLLRPETLTTLAATEDDLNRVLALASRSLRIAGFEARVRNTGMLVKASVKLPETPLGSYVNAWIGIVPSTNGIDIDTARIGKLDIPGWLVRSAMQKGLDAALGKGRGDEAMASIREVAFSQQKVQVTYRPTPNLVAELKDTAKTTYREIAIDIDPAMVRVYYAALVSSARSLSGQGAASFSSYFGPIMALAKQRSVSGAGAAENRAAIVALGIFFGDARFERMVGEVRTGELAGPPPKTSHVKLRGRHDLVQHFTISAALTVTAGLGVADVIGEIKEIADTGAGGSGFSFTDLAADRAGTRFAETATSARGAKWVQNLLAGDPLENMYFPSIAGLPEFMSADEFSRRFGSIDSSEYQRVVHEIDQRLAGLAVFGS